MLVTEYVVWGIPPECDDETVLVSKYPMCFGRGDGPMTDANIAHAIAEACERGGAKSVRVQCVKKNYPFVGWK